jgi:hypothetical protein
MWYRLLWLLIVCPLALGLLLLVVALQPLVMPNAGGGAITSFVSLPAGSQTFWLSFAIGILAWIAGFRALRSRRLLLRATLALLSGLACAVAAVALTIISAVVSAPDRFEGFDWPAVVADCEALAKDLIPEGGQSIMERGVDDPRAGRALKTIGPLAMLITPGAVLIEHSRGATLDPETLVVLLASRPRARTLFAERFTPVRPGVPVYSFGEDDGDAVLQLIEEAEKNP